MSAIADCARHDDDAEFARTATADPQAFIALYDRYVSSVENYVAARIASSDVDDLVSATFTRALARISTYRADRGSFAAWLFTIARNVVTDYYRESARRIAPRTPLRVVTTQPGPEELAVSREEQDRVLAALRHLTSDQRDALALRYAADLPYEAVGQTLGRSEAAAKMLVQRALRTLRDHYNEDDSHD